MMSLMVGAGWYGARKSPSLPLRAPRGVSCGYVLGCGAVATGWALAKVNEAVVPACDRHKAGRHRG